MGTSGADQSGTQEQLRRRDHKQYVGEISLEQTVGGEEVLVTSEYSSQTDADHPVLKIKRAT